MKRIFAVAALMGCGSLSAAPLPLSTACTLEEGATLPPTFAGHDMVAVYNALKSIPGKDEFESEADHATRSKGAVAALPAAIATGQLCAGSMVIRALDNTWKYNAEKKQYEGDVLYLKMHRVGGYYAPLYGKETKRRESSYIGTNAYGVSARIPKTERQTYQVALPQKALITAVSHTQGLETDYETVDAILQMEPADARSYKGRLTQVFQYEVVPPLITQDTEREYPTIDRPTHYEDEQHFIEGRLLKIAVVDVQTGKVLKVYALGDGQ
ncbi:hypothetical protein [uncultured Stenotrophomonas sp.]|uniref:hypothetical protein n=1 Tax=uncultured Stenotrophomonas sp. TaxID=165438 RepID=UPI0028D477AD|nr:hypothetical protein [uncultured Stenotrophomonas sp.]